MLTNDAQALVELTQSLLNQGIIDPFVFNGMVQIEDYSGIKSLDVMLAEYCKNANMILILAKTQLESQEPQYALIDNMLVNLDADSQRVAAKKVSMSITPVRLCLTGDPEDLDVAKSALRSLERDYRVFESQLRKFIEIKKQVYFERTAPVRSPPESSKQGKLKGKKHY